MSDETLDPPLPPIDARTEAVAERLFGLKFALRKDDPKHIHDEWEHAADWIRDGYLRQAIEVLATADRTQAASADGSDYEERMRVEYRELTARAGGSGTCCSGMRMARLTSSPSVRSLC